MCGRSVMPAPTTFGSSSASRSSVRRSGRSAARSAGSKRRWRTTARALRARAREAAGSGVPRSTTAALSVAQVDVARLLLDLVEVRPPSPNDATRLNEAGALLVQAGPALRVAAKASPAQQDALAELDRQSERLGRLTSRRR